uniref:Retrotransposon gag domain-containing protein n=1 Tax=Cannabis sativa TaxID=3483 RepID=A0A803NHM3_CANSA
MYEGLLTSFLGHQRASRRTVSCTNGSFGGDACYQIIDAPMEDRIVALNKQQPDMRCHHQGCGQGSITRLPATMRIGTCRYEYGRQRAFEPKCYGGAKGCKGAPKFRLTWSNTLGSRPQERIKCPIAVENVAYLASMQERVKASWDARDYVKKFSALMLDIKDMNEVDILFYFLEGTQASGLNKSCIGSWPILPSLLKPAVEIPTDYTFENSRRRRQIPD